MANRPKSTLCAAVLLAGLAACESDPYPAYEGPPQVSRQTYGLADTVRDNCRLADKIVGRDWAIGDWQARMAGQAEPGAPPADRLPGGETYAAATRNVAIGDAPAEDVQAMPMQQYALSRLHRSAGDADAELKALVQAVMPPESVAEMRQSPQGQFHLSNKGALSVYTPAMCRLVEICKIRRVSVKNPYACRREW